MKLCIHRMHGMRKLCLGPHKSVHKKLYLYLKFSKILHLPGAHILRFFGLEDKILMLCAGCILNFEHCM